MSPSVTIREHAATCLDLFSQAVLLLAQTGSSNDQNGLLDEFGRFKLWMSNIGVFATVQSSLDYRLRDFGDIRDSFSRQLITIESRLRQLLEAAQQALSKTSTKEDGEPRIPTPAKSISAATFQDWNNTQLLQSIHQSIDWLHRLSNLVRKASFTNQHKRADKFKLKDEDDNDLTDTLTNYYSKLIKREFTSLQDALVERLAASMLTRRRRIMYRRSQQQRWKIQQFEPKSKSIELAIPSTKSAPTFLEQNVPLKNQGAVVTKPAAVATAPSRLTATTVDSNIRRHVSAPSGISQGSTTSLNEESKLLVPPPPKGVKFGKDFVCDYCCLILPSKIALNSNAWANHVNKDLFPYVCVVDNCNDPVEIYASRKDWLAHMRTRHLMRWYCVAKPHTNPLEFDSEEEFTKHMKIEHPGKFRNDQLSLVAENSSRPKDTVFENCPFCIGTPNNLEDHVALHLRDLALRSLPWPDDDERYSQLGEYLHSDNSISNENTRDTITDLMSEPLESNFLENLDDGDEPEHSAGDRLQVYGHFREIADQYKPLDVREQLCDKILSKFAMKKYQGYYPRLATLIKKLEAHPGDKYSHTEAIADFEEVIGNMQQVFVRLDPLEIKNPAMKGRATAGDPEEHVASVNEQRPHNLFEIAIICTLLTEYNAICLIFDEIWEKDYQRSRNDKNVCTTGRVGRHNIVLALLPHTEKLTAAASLAYLGLLYSPLRLFLLVGICGGVAKFGYDEEMLLGDIVISKSVIEYDFNSTSRFSRKDTLGINDGDMTNKTIRLIYRTLEIERWREMLQENTARRLIELQAKEKAREKRPGETKFKYNYPGTVNDRLFRPDYLHKHRTVDGDCSVCNGSPDAICDNALHCSVCNGKPNAICDAARQASCQEIGCEERYIIGRESLIDRQAVEQDNVKEAQEPVIHIGTIASGNIIVMNGLERDKIADQEGVIAFDMDGFGAWDQIQCIFIKGICDYADGHQDVSWQGFAAATAAAATKALLARYVSQHQMMMPELS